MKPAPFEYELAPSAEAAVALLEAAGEDAKLLAGGQSLVPLMNFRLARPSVLIDISRLDELRYVSEVPDGSTGGQLEIGALTRHYDLEKRIQLSSSWAFLTEVAGLIGHLPVRMRGTLGGSLAHADPVAEWCVGVLLLDAELIVRGPRSTRAVDAGSFFKTSFSTDVGHDEMLVRVDLPRAPHVFCLEEYARRAGDFAIVVAGLSADLERGRCRAVRVALGGVAATPVRVESVERALEGEVLADLPPFDVGAEIARCVEPPDDLQASGTHRRELVRALGAACVRRAQRRPVDSGRVREPVIDG